MAAAREGDYQVARRYKVTVETVARWRSEFRIPAAGTVPEHELSAALREARARGRRRRRRIGPADSEDLQSYENSSRELAGHWDYDIRRNVASNPNAGDEALRVVSDADRYSRAPRTQHRRERARYPQVPAAGTTVTYELEDLRWYVARNPSASVALLRRLADSEHDDVAAAVAGSSQAPAVLLRRLAVHASAQVRAAAAANPHLPDGMLDRMIHDSSSGVRAAVARHPGCDESHIRRLAGDSNSRVVTAAIGHSACPPDALAAVAAVSDWQHWDIIAKHPNSPPEALEFVVARAKGVLAWPERRRARRRLREGR